MRLIDTTIDSIKKIIDKQKFFFLDMQCYEDKVDVVEVNNLMLTGDISLGNQSYRFENCIFDNIRFPYNQYQTLSFENCEFRVKDGEPTNIYGDSIFINNCRFEYNYYKTNNHNHNVFIGNPATNRLVYNNNTGYDISLNLTGRDILISNDKNIKAFITSIDNFNKLELNNSTLIASQTNRTHNCNCGIVKGSFLSTKGDSDLSKIEVTVNKLLVNDAAKLQMHGASIIAKKIRNSGLIYIIGYFTKENPNEFISTDKLILGPDGSIDFFNKKIKNNLTNGEAVNYSNLLNECKSLATVLKRMEEKGTQKIDDSLSKEHQHLNRLNSEEDNSTMINHIQNSMDRKTKKLQLKPISNLLKK